MEDLSIERLDEMEAADLAETAENALGWTVSSYDLEFPTQAPLHFGFWTDPIDAMRWAAHYRAEVNSDPDRDEPGWRVVVEPISPATTTWPAPIPVARRAPIEDPDGSLFVVVYLIAAVGVLAAVGVILAMVFS